MASSCAMESAGSSPSDPLAACAAGATRRARRLQRAVRARSRPRGRAGRARERCVRRRRARAGPGQHPTFTRAGPHGLSTTRLSRPATVRSSSSRRTPRDPVSSMMRSANASAASGGASTDSITAERPFFITMGVCHTSSAPAGEELLGGEGELLGGEVVDVGLEQCDRFSAARQAIAGRVAEREPADVGGPDVARAGPVAVRGCASSPAQVRIRRRAR